MPVFRWPTAVALGLLLPAAPLTAVAQAPEPATYRLQTVEVYGQRVRAELEAEQALTPGHVSVVDIESLQQRQVSGMADLLRFVPGFWAVSASGSDNAFLSSRGSNLDATNYDTNGIKLFQDGLPVTAADGNNHNRFIDPLSARYASVAHGANALAYGASTLGGAIDFISPTAHNSAPLEISVNGGSHGQRNLRVTASGVQGSLDGLVSVERKTWDGYRDHSEQERSSVYGNVGWKISDTASNRMFFQYIDNQQELPGNLTAAQVRNDNEQAEHAATRGQGHYQLNVRSWRIANKTTWQLSENSALEAGLSYEEQSLYHPIVDRVMVDFDGPGPLPPTEVFSLLINSDHRDIGGMLRYTLNLGHHDIQAGLNYGRTRVDGGNYRNLHGVRNGLSERVHKTSHSVEAFVLDRWQFRDNWILVYGLQGVWTDRDVSTRNIASGSVRNPSDDYRSLNPRLGLIYQLNPQVSLFASASRLFEAPTTYELEDDVRGNGETLNPMRGSVLEIGSRGRHDFAADSHWHWDVSLYYARIRDEILSRDDPAAPGTSLSANIDRTVHAGVEALIGASFSLGDSGQHRIEPLLSLTFNEFEFDDDPVYGSNRLPAAPKRALRGELLYRHSSGFYAGPTFDAVTKRHADFSNTYTVEGYTLLGFRAGLQRDQWQIFLDLKNLQDRNYIATHSVRDLAAADAAILSPGEPRSVYVGAQLRF